jgi:hypothetical protein
MSADKLSFEQLPEGSRFLFRKIGPLGSVIEDVLVERSPSAGYLKFARMGWMSSCDLAGYELLELLDAEMYDDDMCPNCVTPWKCNGPHLNRPCRGAPGGSPQLDEYLRSLGF